MSASILLHAVLLASSPDFPTRPPERRALVGRRIDAQLVWRSAAAQIPSENPAGAPVAAVAVAVAEVPPAVTVADRGRRRENRTPAAASSTRPLAGPSSTTSPASDARVDAPENIPLDAVSAEDLRQYRVDLAVAARRFKAYPELARARGWQGTAEVVLEAGIRSPVPRVFVLRSSGHDLLDAQAVDILTRAARATSMPATLQARALRLVVAVRFDVDD